MLSHKFREAVKKSKDINMKSEEEFPVGYSTGFLPFDFFNGVVVKTNVNGRDIEYNSIGLTDGSLNMIIGRSGSGKTTWTVQSAFEIVKDFKTACVFHDSIEAGTNDLRRQKLTKLVPEELKDKFISRNTGINTENFYERINMIYDLKLQNKEEYMYDTGLYDIRGEKIYKFEPTVYILDSLSLLTPEKYTEEETASGQMSTTASAKMNAQIFRRMLGKLKTVNIIVMVINHINDDVQIGLVKKAGQLGYLPQGTTLPGGKVPVFLSNNLILLHEAKIKEDKDYNINGAIVKMEMVKSRSARSGKSIELVYDPLTGFDNELSILHLLKENKYLNGSPGHYYLGEYSDAKFSLKNFKIKLRENPTLLKAFREQSRICLQSLIEKSKFDFDNDSEDVLNLNKSILDGLTMNII